MQKKPIVRVQTRYTEDIHSWLGSRAGRNKRSMNSELIYILEKVKESEERKQAAA